MYERKKSKKDHCLIYHGKYICVMGTLWQMRNRYEKIPAQYQDDYAIRPRGECQGLIDLLKVEVKHATETGSRHIEAEQTDQALP